MTVVGKIGRPHGKHGMVKVIPATGMDEILSRINSAVVISTDGYKCELENLRKYTRGRFIGTLNGFRSKEEVKRFQGGQILCLINS